MDIIEAGMEQEDQELQIMIQTGQTEVPYAMQEESVIANSETEPSV